MLASTGPTHGVHAVPKTTPRTTGAAPPTDFPGRARLLGLNVRWLIRAGRSPARVFSREALVGRVWGDGYFGDVRLVDVHVRRLRTKVEHDAANPRHVVTVRGLGYRLQ